MGRGIQHSHLMKRFRPELLGPPSLPQELGSPLLAARPFAASPHCRIFTAAKIIKETYIILYEIRDEAQTIDIYMYTLINENYIYATIAKDSFTIRSI